MRMGFAIPIHTFEVAEIFIPCEKILLRQQEGAYCLIRSRLASAFET